MSKTNAPNVGQRAVQYTSVPAFMRMDGPDHSPVPNTDQPVEHHEMVCGSVGPGSALSYQVGGYHYSKLKIQPVEFIVANNIGYLEGNVIKYVVRHKDKNGVSDLKKAQHYLQMLIEQYK